MDKQRKSNMGPNKCCNHGTCAIVGYCLHEIFNPKASGHGVTTTCHECHSLQQVKSNRRRSSDCVASPRQKKTLVDEVVLQDTIPRSEDKLIVSCPDVKTSEQECEEYMTRIRDLPVLM
ncbi:hypothetical protein GUITHDRAFT_112598 [Guillardia theta CCMP2712]|uniref:Uncharacterized protein n=2 Tax=Guillardia theta TaxID=55529 RepID=L1IZQ5_GUITC|nr:hypothetical protein GUITHDRAFT_112598 [Guillardia theta CCMP2712]EKX41384.1 hypothetical protein GUITHDRAFT_112598 [Guillardia theta CCMP2712]|mmetsp:Transcript_7824/g.26264  ORF Transcript_7824/g.26264 Transcript_7824/m.26264 type:complete len:119 (+) Transcript_7824:246-602(+)|eukprot:XP_005828364.1 hypothetical protein GUITHDRAFT_112598 [Guillardia theta CCMP2712]